MERYREILDFWFGPKAGAGLWFGASESTDRYVRERFSADLTDAAAGKLAAWEDSPESALALVVLLDQFSMQLNRKQRLGYELSARAIPISERAITRRFDRGLGCDQRGFLYMPFMHAEDLALQDRSVRLYSALARECPPGSVEGFLRSAREHRDIVRKYGRFPGRNASYGRQDAAGEKTYLEQGGYF